MVVDDGPQREVGAVADEPEHVVLADVEEVVGLAGADLVELGEVVEELDAAAVHAAHHPH